MRGQVFKDFSSSRPLKGYSRLYQHHRACRYCLCLARTLATPFGPAIFSTSLKFGADRFLQFQQWFRGILCFGDHVSFGIIISDAEFLIHAMHYPYAR